MTVYFLQKAEIYTGGCPPYYITFYLKISTSFVKNKGVGRNPR